ncbi:4-coumarate--CoA ligase 1 [Halocaridina rubra]|uniref:4-coumarate--CoA ligase 1 n=1 Tax=Halocaridina rubra TaxID=373956 RepID=A0AAN8WEJ9_HALRR
MKKTLVSAGVSQGDAVLMVCRNHIDIAAALLAILHIGAICVPVGADLTIGELTHIIGVSKTKWAVVSEGGVTKVIEAFSSHGPSCLRQLWLLGAVSSIHPTLGERISTVISDSYMMRDDFNSHETVAMMPFSSGTTGLPKGVMVSHRNLVTNHVIAKYLQTLNELSTINIYDSTLLAIPVYHMYGHNVTMNTLMTGGKVVILPKFSPRHYLEAIQNYKVTFAPVVPYIANLLVDSAMMKKYDFSSLFTFAVSSAPIAETTLNALMQKTGKNASQGYGMTETTGPATVSKGEPGCRANEIGQILPFFEGKIILMPPVLLLVVARPNTFRNPVTSIPFEGVLSGITGPRKGGGPLRGLCVPPGCPCYSTVRARPLRRLGRGATAATVLLELSSAQPVRATEYSNPLHLELKHRRRKINELVYRTTLANHHHILAQG